MNKLSLRTRIFIAMIFLVVIASVLIAAITIYQYNEQADDYHNDRLQRKEEAIKSAIIYELERNTLDQLQSSLLPEILDKKLNKDSFRRRMLASGVLVPTGELEKDVGHRPAELYRFKRMRGRR